MFCWLEPRPQAATRSKIMLPRQRVRNDAATPLEERTEVPEHQGQQREGLWLAASEVRLQFYAAPESGGRQPQHPSRSHQPISLCPAPSQRKGTKIEHDEQHRLNTKVQRRNKRAGWAGSYSVATPFIDTQGFTNTENNRPVCSWNPGLRHFTNLFNE